MVSMYFEKSTNSFEISLECQIKNLSRFFYLADGDSLNKNTNDLLSISGGLF